MKKSLSSFGSQLFDILSSFDDFVFAFRDPIKTDKSLLILSALSKFRWCLYLKKSQMHSCQLKKKKINNNKEGKNKFGTFPEQDTFTAYRMMFFCPL